MFDAEWGVSDNDGDLETVELTLRDLDDEEVEDSKTINISGETAENTTRLIAFKEEDSGHTYEVELVVTDEAGNTATATDTAVENGEEDEHPGNDRGKRGDRDRASASILPFNVPFVAVIVLTLALSSLGVGLVVRRRP